MRHPKTPPPSSAALRSLGDGASVALFLTHASEPAPRRKYRHWDEVRHLTPPEGLTIEQYWAALKLARRQGRRDLQLTDPNGKQFSFITTDHIWEMLHQIDQNASGRIQVPEPITNPATRDRYIQSSLIEEALTSSQIEGAVATREQAKELIRGNRKPNSRHERMVFNNYRALALVREHVGEPLSVDLIRSIHSVITDETMDEQYSPPYFRKEGDGIAVRDEITGEVFYTPPPAGQLPKRMKALCEFANRVDEERFIHPVIKAILLHFWLAIDHPFVDGNGRTARALFYWSMLRSNYWLSEYISISKFIKEGQISYNLAFLYAESDECDATYFIDHQLRIILRAIAGLHQYIATKAAEIQQTEKLISILHDLNHRQISILTHALRHPRASYTIRSHQSSHRVSYQTARTDLLELTEHELLDLRKVGNRYGFIAPDNLLARLQRRGLHGPPPGAERR